MSFKMLLSRFKGNLYPLVIEAQTSFYGSMLSVNIRVISRRAERESRYEADERRSSGALWFGSHRLSPDFLSLFG